MLEVANRFLQNSTTTTENRFSLSLACHRLERRDGRKSRDYHDRFARRAGGQNDGVVVAERNHLMYCDG